MNACTYVLRLGETQQFIKIGCGYGCLWECYNTLYLLMKFYFSLNNIEEKEQKSKFSKNSNSCTSKQ